MPEKAALFNRQDFIGDICLPRREPGDAHQVDAISLALQRQRRAVRIGAI
jgi:hypothetical protein